MIKDLLDTLLTGRSSPKTRYQAKNRLQLVIAHDRADINPEIIEKMRQEILEVVSRYLDIDIEQTAFSLETYERMTALTANLPIKRVKTNPDIQ
jgi:cell division topological specificity factor